jgi:enoyl-CoA hydratase/carnithine racemase
MNPGAIAFDEEMFDALVAAAEAARDNTALAAVVLSGNGQSFCAGLDPKRRKPSAHRQP